MYRLCLIVPLLCLLHSPFAAAGPGDFDASFGVEGKAAVAFDLPGGDRDDQALASFPLADGKLMVVGTVSPDGSSGVVRLGFTRLLANGSVDPSYGSGGKFSVETALLTVVSAGTDNAGRFYVGGAFLDPGNLDIEFGVQRFNTDGTADLGYGFFGLAAAAFDRGGNNEDRLRSIRVAPGGEVYAVGRIKVGAGADFDFGVAKFNPLGALDNNFDGDGLRTIAFDLDGTVREDDAQAIADFDPNRLVIAGTALRSSGQRVVAVAVINSISGAFTGNFCNAGSCQGSVQESLVSGPGRRTLAFDPQGVQPTDTVFAAAMFVAIGGGPIAIAGRSTDGQSTRGALAILRGDGTLATTGPQPFGRLLVDLFNPTALTAVAYDVGRSRWLLGGRAGTTELRYAFAASTDSTPTLVAGFGINGSGPPDFQLIQFPRSGTGAIENEIASAIVDAQGRYLLTGRRLWTRSSGIEDNDFAVTRLADQTGGAIFANGFE
ncbi:MAG: hypothetical protein AB7E72_04700 [Lysobacterales bacterium]